MVLKDLWDLLDQLGQPDRRENVAHKVKEDLLVPRDPEVRGVLLGHRVNLELPGSQANQEKLVHREREDNVENLEKEEHQDKQVMYMDLLLLKAI